MSFQAYLDNIEAKTGQSPEDFKRQAREKGYTMEEGLSPGIKAADIITWLAEDYALGRGHAMAIFALLKGKSVGGTSDGE
jgi:hypothetical protein